MILMKKLRKEKGWSGSRLAREAEMNQSSISQIENGRINPYPIQIEKIAKALNWQGDPQELFAETE